jgi:hypothetical protein
MYISSSCYVPSQTISLGFHYFSIWNYEVPHHLILSVILWLLYLGSTYYLRYFSLQQSPFMFCPWLGTKFCTHIIQPIKILFHIY